MEAEVSELVGATRGERAAQGAPHIATATGHGRGRPEPARLSWRFRSCAAST